MFFYGFSMVLPMFCSMVFAGPHGVPSWGCGFENKLRHGVACVGDSEAGKMFPYMSFPCLSLRILRNQINRKLQRVGVEDVWT